MQCKGVWVETHILTTLKHLELALNVNTKVVCHRFEFINLKFDLPSQSISLQGLLEARNKTDKQRRWKIFWRPSHFPWRRKQMGISFTEYRTIPVWFMYPVFQCLLNAKCRNCIGSRSRAKGQNGGKDILLSRTVPRSGLQNHIPDTVFCSFDPVSSTLDYLVGQLQQKGLLVLPGSLRHISVKWKM